MAKLTPKQHMEMQRKIAAESGSNTFIAPPGTDKLPIAERLHIYLEVFENGCSVSQPPIGDGRPETCPECVREFVNVVKQAVNEEICSDPLNAMLPVCSVIVEDCPACGEKYGAHKQGCRPTQPGSEVRIYTPPAANHPRCIECGQRLPNHIPGCPQSTAK